MSPHGVSGFRPSEPPLSSGVAFMIIGPVFVGLGALTEMPLFAIVGGVGILVGAVSLIRGVSRLASHIDRLELDRRVSVDMAEDD